MCEQGVCTARGSVLLYVFGSCCASRAVRPLALLLSVLLLHHLLLLPLPFPSAPPLSSPLPPIPPPLRSTWPQVDVVLVMEQDRLYSQLSSALQVCEGEGGGGGGHLGLHSKTGVVRCGASTQQGCCCACHAN